jgi:hypothetical protein
LRHVIGRIQRRDIAAPGAALQAATPATGEREQLHTRSEQHATPFAPLVLSYRVATLSTDSLRAQLDAGSPVKQTKLGLCARSFVRHFVPVC